MRRGCISLGDVKCDECEKTVAHSERYMAVEEEEGAESDTGKTYLYCMECAAKKGYATHRHDKEGDILTIFPQS